MTAAERQVLNDVRRWQYLPVRIANEQRKIRAFEAALARECAEPHRNQKRIGRLREQIAGAAARIASAEAQLQ